ncbi:hypothetical protein FHW88_005200 [Mucilaginibacter sp. SG538B]|uniref:hypothetical protein n=1 Tax=Mucilaginibacter sp. SG538B TaxID=2587021 RepID=UPI00159E0938|nr:hypothetical protein [Mucilaginibacter sp. SG538B]NVM66882.1 hypothetical protein [Mucilaginibacter sp. SG538B]
MEASLYKKPKEFSSRKISITQAIKILKRSGVEISEDQVSIILDFLYLLARTFKLEENLDR